MQDPRAKPSLDFEMLLRVTRPLSQHPWMITIPLERGRLSASKGLSKSWVLGSSANYSIPEVSAVAAAYVCLSFFFPQLYTNFLL